MSTEPDRVYCVIDPTGRLLAALTSPCDAAELSKEHAQSTVQVCVLNSIIAPDPCVHNYKRDPRSYDDMGGSWTCTQCGDVYFGRTPPRNA